jgi:hypothetical protein
LNEFAEGPYYSPFIKKITLTRTGIENQKTIINKTIKNNKI